jgi:hypothetical protein
MTTTTTPLVAALLEGEQLGWDVYDWQDSYAGDVYACSVLRAADDEGLLSCDDTLALFREHSACLAEYIAHLEQLRAQGLPAAHTRHAGQALVWLGY